jgi:hypothetical protein
VVQVMRAREQAERHAVVLLHAVPTGITCAQVEYCAGMTRIGTTAVKLHRLCTRIHIIDTQTRSVMTTGLQAIPYLPHT